MMIIKYKQRIIVPLSDEQERDREIFYEIQSPWNSQTEEIAKSEAYNGEYEIIDDGEPEPPPTTEQRVSDLEEQLAQSDETAIALYEAQEAQEAINAQQDEALMEIYEMIGL